MGDTAGRQPLSFTRALWAVPIDGEGDAPTHRIIHARVLQLHAPATLRRLGLRSARGYHKCGSTVDRDWVTAFRILLWDGQRWQPFRHVRGLERPEDDAVQWFDLEGVETTAVMLEVRHCGIDAWWPSWNLVSGAFALEGDCTHPHAPRREQLLDADVISLDGLPEGLSATVEEGAVRFRSRFLDVGFRLSRAGLTHLGLDEGGRGRTTANLLRQAPGLFWQGPQLHPVGAAPIVAPALRNRVRGTTCVRGNTVTYDVTLGDDDQHYRLAWEVHPDRLVLHAERRADRAMRAWRSAAWQLGLDCTVTPAHVLGATQHEGETGLMPLPAWLHLPRHGSLLVHATTPGAPVHLRADAWRPIELTTTELKLGEIPQPEGDYLLPAGRHAATLAWRLDRPDVPLRDDTPADVRRAVETCTLTALTYRADTATLTNNGASMHCPLCMDNWSATTTRLGHLLPHLAATDLLRDSLERWLGGGPGYGSGRLLVGGRLHMAEDEYLMTGTAGLLGLADFLEHERPAAWLARFRRYVAQQLDAMRARDLDGDGLVESPYRTGVSGTGQWSTCWFDVISFGWKDAFSNALLYTALRKLAMLLPELGQADLAGGLDAWADRLKASYRPAFYNPETGWLAGWRCKEDRLHDYAFLAVNGAAVCNDLLDTATARAAIERLWAEAQRVGMPDPYYGLPGNLWHIPDDDLGDIMQGYPLGYYQNGGRTHSQARHFVGALYRVGMTDEADHLLQRLCRGLADGAVYGGCGSGRDWRHWDDRPCGYEGLLTDQFGILSVALQRYGTGGETGRRGDGASGKRRIRASKGAMEET